jgi:hypothetical protein
MSDNPMRGHVLLSYLQDPDQSSNQWRLTFLRDMPGLKAASQVIHKPHDEV